ncbi:baseplate assembly protein [Stenotrophomonas maltophilia]|uniref:baseplate assembly protein n=1 Tax=Stenotrophomonas maltophilia TaxID=40324 RepID=UPI001F3C8BFD|nr:baseplate J/gp47 family protein [Stenotrophomonas maltophilia]MCF3530878.1 baseplate assembly protein [Stenotrophomonas maltophilia]MCF3534762.1 baseplate assembly protein [Stenotrophomonas maltophilia]
MSAFTAVDLSKLPVPDLVEQVNFEQAYADQVAMFMLVMPEYGPLLESDPVAKLLQANAYREMLLRESFNVRATASMLPYARGADLDNLGAFFGIARQVLSPGDPAANLPAEFESDTDFRRRIQLAPEGYSVAGPEGAYLFHALSADADVLDVSALSPRPGEVVVTLLARSGDGVPSAALVDRVLLALRDGGVRPLTDFVTVQPADVIRYRVDASIVTFAGPDSDVVMAEAERRIREYVAASQRLGRDVPRSGIFAALHVEGVQRVELREPATDISIGSQQAAYCSQINLIHGGSDE